MKPRVRPAPKRQLAVLSRVSSRGPTGRGAEGRQHEVRGNGRFRPAWRSAERLQRLEQRTLRAYLLCPGTRRRGVRARPLSSKFALRSLSVTVRIPDVVPLCTTVSYPR